MTASVIPYHVYLSIYLSLSLWGKKIIDDYSKERPFDYLPERAVDTHRGWTPASCCVCM